MRALKAFVLGSLAFGIVGYALAAALAVAAQAGGSTLDVGSAHCSSCPSRWRGRRG